MPGFVRHTRFVSILFEIYELVCAATPSFDRTARKPTFAITISGPSENVKRIRCKMPFLPQTGKATNARACKTSPPNRHSRGHSKGELRLRAREDTGAP